jgi:uncharacterized membrane protein
MDIVAILIAGLLLIGVPIAAIVGATKASRLEREVFLLRRRLAMVEDTLDRMRENGAEPTEAPIEEPAAQHIEQEPPVEPIAAKPEPAPWTPAPMKKPSLVTEQALTERWLVWLGGLALALGGAFLVKYSAEQGLLGPAVRVTLGALIGMAAAPLGHWLSRREAATSSLPSQVPPALVGGGAAMVFSSVYAAYGLYGLMPPLVAFAALAATASATVLMSLGHGPFVALLGLVGAFAAPLLVSSTEPSAIGLFTYLVVISAGILALLRWRAWWWLAWAVLGGATGWTAIWLMTSWRVGDELILGLYLCALCGLFAAFRLGLPTIAVLAGRAEAPMVRRVVLAAAGVIALLALAVVHTADFSALALALPFVLGVGFLAFGSSDQEFDRLPWIGAAVAALVLAGWDLGPLSRPTDLLAPVLPGQTGRFAWSAAGFAALYGATGLLLVGRTARPGRWATVSAATPLVMLALAYWRLSPLGYSWAWAAGALALGAVLVAAAERLRRHEAALAAYAVGAVGALAMAATFGLEEAWLTVALAALPAGIAWVETHLPLAALRRVALLLAAVVLVRLALNPYVLHYPIGASGVLNWLIYGYGVPAIAFALAARTFRRSADDALVAVLEAGAIAFAVLLVSLEIRHLMAGGLNARGYSLTERSLHTIAWMAGAAVLFLAHARSGRQVPRVAGGVLLLAASFQAVLLQALFSNPLLTGVPVGERLLLNDLLLTFAAPAALYALHARLAPPLAPWVRPACAALGLGFSMLWATLEVRHGFAGERLTLGTVGQAEQWSYSVLWLVGGVTVLLGGLRLGSTGFRRAGLAMVLLVVAKVFLVDLSHTAGIWRALSFLGLGAALVGIGWLYRRFVRGEVGNDSSPAA